MSDPNDDTLFSQDDIDRLLNAQSLEEAEESIVNKGEENRAPLSAGEEDADDLIGELSQDDIDRLLNATSASVEQEESPPDVETKDEVEENEDDDDLGELSQDDIDRMLTSRTPDEPDAIADIETDERDDADAFDLISQDDINKLMATDDMPSSPFSNPDIISDIDALGLDEQSESIISPDFMSGTEGVADRDPMSAEEVIDPSEAWDIKDCLITQDTIDNLLNLTLEEPDISDSDLFSARTGFSEEEPFKVNLSEDDPEFNLDSGDDIAGADELDNLLNEAAGDMDDLLNDISQDDIDGLLRESDDQTSDDDQGNVGSEISGDESVRNVISQDDIDALLAGTDEGDEDILADMEMDEDLKGSASPVRNVESALPEDDAAQVILEEADESATTLADGTVRQLSDVIDVAEKKPQKKRGLLKIIMILLLVLTVMAGCVAGVYFMFFKEKVDKLIRSSQPAVKVEDAVPVTTDVPNINIKESQELTPGTIILDNFMVLAPERKDGITYISVDISIEYSHSTVFDAINSKLPYYRGVIYDAINAALKSDSGYKLTESELLKIVQNALNQSLPDMKLNKVLFVNFKIG